MKQVQQSSDTPAPQKDSVAGSALQDFSLPDERGQRTRDRVLLYVRGMDVAPLRSLAFAAESLGRSGSSPSQAEAMHSLWEVLREEGRLEGREYGLNDGESGKLDSAPPHEPPYHDCGKTGSQALAYGHRTAVLRTCLCFGSQYGLSLRSESYCPWRTPS